VQHTYSLGQSLCGGGFEYLHRDPTSRRRRQKGNSVLEATLFLGDINTGPDFPGWGSLEPDSIKYGHESRGTRTQELLWWRGPAAIVNGRPVPSSQRAPNIKKSATVRNKNLVVSPRWCLKPRQTGQLTVGRNITLTLTYPLETAYFSRIDLYLNTKATEARSHVEHLYAGVHYFSFLITACFTHPDLLKLAEIDFFPSAVFCLLLITLRCIQHSSKVVQAAVRAFTLIDIRSYRSTFIWKAGITTTWQYGSQEQLEVFLELRLKYRVPFPWHPFAFPHDVG
jgi:hypothetical protein